MKENIKPVKLEIIKPETICQVQQHDTNQGVYKIILREILLLYGHLYNTNGQKTNCRKPAYIIPPFKRTSKIFISPGV